MDMLKIPFWKLMLYATVIMWVQGFSYLWLSTGFAFGTSVLAWHRKLFMIPYVLLTLIFSKEKTLFMDFFMVGIVMAVIRSYGIDGENAKLTAYLDTLIGAIPDQQAAEYCENKAVNAIVFHYAALAEKNGIALAVKLTVPEHSERISDTSLCVIFVNLLENAIEACARMTEGEKFVRLYSGCNTKP